MIIIAIGIWYLNYYLLELQWDYWKGIKRWEELDFSEESLTCRDWNQTWKSISYWLIEEEEKKWAQNNEGNGVNSPMFWSFALLKLLIDTELLGKIWWNWVVILWVYEDLNIMIELCNWELTRNVATME